MMNALEIFIVGRFRLGAKFQLRIFCYYLIPMIVKYTTKAKSLGPSTTAHIRAIKAGFRYGTSEMYI